MQYVSKEPIRQFGGKIIGWVETDKFGNQLVRNFGGKIIGRYDKINDCTRDFGGKILTKGNTAIGLLYSSKHNSEIR